MHMFTNFRTDGSAVWETSWIRIRSMGDILDPDPHGSAVLEPSRIRIWHSNTDPDGSGSATLTEIDQYLKAKWHKNKLLFS